MTSPEQIEEQAVRMWRVVYWEDEGDMELARSCFHSLNSKQQEGWLELARRVFSVTTPETLKI